MASHVRGAHPAQYAAWSGRKKTGAKSARGPGRPRKSLPVAVSMSGGMSDIVSRLEQQKRAIESALEALRLIGGE